MLVLHRTMESTELNPHLRDGYKVWEADGKSGVSKIGQWLGGIAGTRTQVSRLLNQAFFYHLLQGRSAPSCLHCFSLLAIADSTDWPLFWLIPSVLAPNRSPHWLLPPAQNAHEPSQVLTALTWSAAICYPECLARLICLLASHGCTCPMPRISLLSYLTSYYNEWLGIFV